MRTVEDLHREFHDKDLLQVSYILEREFCGTVESLSDMTSFACYESEYLDDQGEVLPIIPANILERGAKISEK